MDDGDDGGDDDEGDGDIYIMMKSVCLFCNEKSSLPPVQLAVSFHGFSQFQIGFSCFQVGFYGFQGSRLVFMVFHGFLWFFMAFHDTRLFLWFQVSFHVIS